ncbi:MAG: ComF family protein [bacterium]
MIQKWLTDLIFPPQCFLTGQQLQNHGDLSAPSWQQLNFIDAPICDSCGIPFEIGTEHGIICAACLSGQYEKGLISAKGLDKIRAALRYDDVSAQLVMRLKYGDRTDGVNALARLLALAGSHFLKQERVIIIPVPLHRNRLRQRRYNQAALLAKALARQTGRCAQLDALKRMRDTGSQQGKTAKARHRNVDGAFQIVAKYKERVKGVDVILVDDVLTTGATLKACAKALKRAGAKSVTGLVLARVVKQSIIAI